MLGFGFRLLDDHPLLGFYGAVEGLVIGLLCWLPFYALGWLGAGDVKLYAAASAWLGPRLAIQGAFVAALCGAVLAIIWMVRRSGLRRTGETLGLATGTPRILYPGASGAASKLPYGLAIAAGALWAGWLSGATGY
jgi:prepilin peptidase CpaA